MVYASENLDLSTLSNRKTVIALEVTLNQSLCNLKDLVLEFEQLQIEVTAQREKCERKACVGSEALKKVIEIKDNIIQSVASALTTLNETKDMSIIHEAFKILCGETASLTPPTEKHENKLTTPKKEGFSEITDVLNDESISEIDGTPTGRTSPIILSKKYRNTTASDFREKKKCPDNWPISENKTMKLLFPTPVKGKTGSKLRQARFTFVKQKSVVDLTSSPELSGGAKQNKEDVNCFQLDIKKEPLDDEDTIQPSPTSITPNFPGLYRSAITPLKKTVKNSPKKITTNSPCKFVKKQLQLSKLQIKTENTSKYNVGNVESKVSDQNLVNMEESINLLRPVNRFQTPTKQPVRTIDPEEADCEIDSSLSLLRPATRHDRISPENKEVPHSQTKAPLSENINCTNLQTQCDTVSMSILEQEPNEMVSNDLELVSKSKENRVKVEPVFKEPTVRKKAEKRALPGWSCDECKNFYAELYKDNPDMLAKKMDECSKHRGRNNPIRPKTPPGFWYPRWDVPEDTEEFNRRNNAV